MAVQFFYDEQIRRFLLQFTRIFSGFQVEYGRDENGNPTYLQVPCRYGDASKQAQTILQNNSASNMPCAPMITFYITGMDYVRDRIQDPYFVDRKSVRQREYDPATQTYAETQGNAFTVERHMPAPWDMKLRVDVWTTNTHQKFQMFEQMGWMFNPSLEIQSTDNYLDWTSLSRVELDRNSFSSRSIPHNDEDIDIMSWDFTLPIWITPPAKVYKGGIIHRVINNMYDADGDLHNALYNDDLLMGTRLKVTPHGFRVFILDNTIQLLPANAVGEDPYNFDPIELQDSEQHWRPAVEEYGILRDGISQIRIWNDLNQSEIIGTVSYHPTDETLLIFNVDTDTLPANTLDPVDAVIDPLRSGPGYGLLSATTGQRYLLTDDAGSDQDSEVVQAWAGTGGEELIASKNDIIEYDGTQWNVVYTATDNTDFVTNITTGLQYRWTGNEWVRSWEGLYPGGEWALVI